MLCHQLSVIGLTPAELLSGSFMNEPRVRPECTLSDWAIQTIQRGKDDSINHMLIGGNGFPVGDSGMTPIADTAHDMGCQQERRDLRANLVWERDLVQALADRKRGRIDG